MLKVFLTIAKEENITRAAGLLHVTQPTLSRQLMQLEEELGVQLFRRSNLAALGMRMRRPAAVPVPSRCRMLVALLPCPQRLRAESVPTAGRILAVRTPKPRCSPCRPWPASRRSNAALLPLACGFRAVPLPSIGHVSVGWRWYDGQNREFGTV